MNTQISDPLVAICKEQLTGTQVLLVRHGETDWNREKRFQGHTDIALNAQGVEQAQLLAQRLRQVEAALGHPLFSQVVHSDLSRASHTAGILTGGDNGIQTHQDRGLRERHYGHLAGLTGDEMQAKCPSEFAHLKNRDPDGLITGGESLSQFYRRVVATYESILAKAQGHRLLIVAHGGVLDCIYRHCTNHPLQPARSWLLPNCALNVIYHPAQGPATVRLWADTSHLQGPQGRDEVDGRIA